MTNAWKRICKTQKTMSFSLERCQELLSIELPEFQQFVTPANRKSCRFHPVFIVVPLFVRSEIKWTLTTPWNMFSESLCYQFEVEIRESK
jgi:hypothetical protein